MRDKRKEKKMKVKINEKMIGILLIAVFILSTFTLALPSVSAAAAAANETVWIEVTHDGIQGTGETNYTTISAAITAASAGDTIYVGNGSYAETLTIPPGKDGLELRGAQYGVDARGRTGDESILTSSGSWVYRSQSADTVFDGFHLNGTGSTGQDGVYIDYSNFTVSNNIFVLFEDESIFVESDSGAITAGTIHQNMIYGTGTSHIEYR